MTTFQNDLDGRISEYVQKDTTAFCTYDEYKAALVVFADLCERRGESVRGQLDGTVPATTAAQAEDPALLVSAEGLDLTALGSMMGGKGGTQEGGAMQAPENFPEGAKPAEPVDGRGGMTQNRNAGMRSEGTPDFNKNVLSNRLKLYGALSAVLGIALLLVSRYRRKY